MDGAVIPWPADSVERRPIGSIVAYDKNARIHSPEQIAQIAASMREWGFTIPLLVDEAGVLIAGHGRHEAAKLIGYDSVPVMVARGWTAKQIKAYRIADNRLALNAAWDVKLLAAELTDLPGMDALIGFAEGELEQLLKAASGDGEDGRPLPTPAEAKQTLAERFGVPPFTVLNAREGWWQDRKRAWIALGLESELGRGENPVESAPGGRKPRAGKKLAMSKTIQREKPHADKALDGDKRRERQARKIYPGKGQDLVREGYQKNGGRQ